MAHEDYLAIGELAERTGVTRSALRYYEEIGLISPDIREGGQRRYTLAAVTQTGMILLLRDAGFSLDEIRRVMHPDTGRRSDSWRDIAARKVDELEDRIAKSEAARSALLHALAHHHDDPLGCPRFSDAVTDALCGVPLRNSHPH